MSQQWEIHCTEAIEQLRTQPDCEFDKKGRQLIDIGHDGAWSNSSTSFSSKNGFTTAITTIDGKSQIINAGTRSNYFCREWVSSFSPPTIICCQKFCYYFVSSKSFFLDILSFYQKKMFQNITQNK